MNKTMYEEGKFSAVETIGIPLPKPPFWQMKICWVPSINDFY
jgi:hypothetical protein